MSESNAGFDIRYIAELARLKLDDKQAESLRNDLQNIVNYIAELDELDVSKIEPTAHVASVRNAWRADEARPSFERDAMLKNAPETAADDTLIKVPQTLPGEGSN